jgi:hypothetical protein
MDYDVEKLRKALEKRIVAFLSVKAESEVRVNRAAQFTFVCRTGGELKAG